MDAQRKTLIGQKFVVGFYGTEITDEFRAAVEKYHFGNIILFRENLQDSEQTRRLCKDLHDLVVGVTGIAPIISIDQEGGMVTRLTDDSINIPGAMALAATENEELLKRMNFINGEILLDHGFNLNLGPVLDINCEPDNPVIGVRSYSDQPETVAKYGRLAFEALQEAGIMSSAKHFPGHGDTNVDSHVGLPKVDISREELEKREFVPFREAAANNITTIMTTHILFPQLEKENLPATMSKTILTGILRGEMGYKGLIISDCMEMDAIAVHYGSAYGTKKAFGAGVDLVFISHTPSIAITAVEEVYAALESGELSWEEMEASVARIQEFKQEWIREPMQIDENTYQTYREEIRRAIPQTFCSLPEHTEISAFPINENTLYIGPDPYRASNVSNLVQGGVSFARNVAQGMGATGIVSSPLPTEEEIADILRRAETADAIVLGLYNAHVYTQQLELWKALRTLGKPIMVAALRNPYDLMYLNQAKEIGFSLFEYTGKSMLAFIELLQGKVDVKAKLPIALPQRSL